MDYYYTYTNENIDQINLLINSILKKELNKIKLHLFYHLQKNIINQIIQILLEPSLLEDYSDNDVIIDEQIMNEQPNLKFIFKILKLFVEQDQIESLISILFPISLINLIFDLF